MTHTRTILGTIGDTPLIELAGVIDSSARVVAKLESHNPLGSVKDRVALAMIDAAQESGALLPGGTIVEPSSGNTGIALAMVAAVRGYRCVVVMPESMSMERRKVILAMGAELVLTPASAGVPGAIARAAALTDEIDGAFMPQQFSNPANAQVHYETTGPELWADAGHVDVFVAGVGTGGTLTGVGRYLREQNPDVKLIAIEPHESPVLTQHRAGEPLVPGAHGIQGIGTGFVPELLDMSLIDEVKKVTTLAALDWARRGAQAGIFVGISSGAALCAASQLAARPDLAGKTIATILPSYGERYLSTPLFSSLGNE